MGRGERAKEREEESECTNMTRNRSPHPQSRKMLIMTAHALTIIEHFTRLVSSVRFDHPRDAYSGAIVFSRLLKTCTDLSTSFSEEIVYILDAVVVFQVLTVGAYFSGCKCSLARSRHEIVQN